MKKAFLPLTGVILIAAILLSGTVYRNSYVAPWDAAAGSSGSVRSTIEGLLLPAAKTALRLSANAENMEGTGELVTNPGGETGETDAGCDFPENFYPYRAMLNDRQKRVYNQAYANAVSLNRNPFVLVDTVSEQELIDVMSALINDQPGLFYLETKYSYGYLLDKSVVSLTLAFNALAQDQPRHAAAFEAAADAILSKAKSLSSDVEKEKYVHDALLAGTEYDTNAANNQSAYSALVLGSSVCAGYSRALQYLLLRLGIPCYYCEGTVDGGNHAWNIVALSDGYYNVDASWDDVSADDAMHSFFNLSDAEIGKDHIRRGLSVNLPACNAKNYAHDALFANEKQQPAQQEKRATYESLGYSDGDVIRSLSAYYGYCEEALTRRGVGTHTLDMVISDIDLVNEIYAATRNKDYLDGYARAVAENLALSNCSFSLKLSADYLAAGYVLLTQETTITAGETAATATPEITIAPTATPAPTPETTSVPMATAEPSVITPAPTDAEAATPDAAAELPLATAEPGEETRRRPHNNAGETGGVIMETGPAEEF